MNKFIIGAALILSSCSPIAETRDTYVAFYQGGSLDQSEACLDQVIQKKIPDDKYTRCGDSVMLLLDRAMIRFIEGDTKGSIHDFNLCLDALDYYGQTHLMDTVGQVLLEDSVAPFTGDDYEQLLARLYFAMVLLHEGDTSNAFALLRQAEEWSQEKTSEYAASPATASLKVTENPLGKYLFAALLEKKGDLSNSRILYQEAENLSQGEFPVPDLKPKKPTLLLITHNGNSPYKFTQYTDASKVSLIALEIFLCGNGKDFALSSLTGLPTPALAYYPSSEAIFIPYKINNSPLISKPIFAVDHAACLELQGKMPIIVARSAARYILRRAAVMEAQRRDPNMGVLCDIGMLIVNARTEADTRSWSLLPRQIELARADLEPGSYELQIGQAVFPIQLKGSDLAIVHVFNIHPGVTKVLIPERFQEKNP